MRVVMRCIKIEVKNHGWEGQHAGPLEAVFEIAYNPEPIFDHTGRHLKDVVLAPHMTEQTPYATARIQFADPAAHDLYRVGGYYAFTISGEVVA